MFSSKYVLRVAEQAAAAFVVAFGGFALAGNGSLSSALIPGAVAAGLRALYGVVVKAVGDSESPSAL